MKRARLHEHMHQLARRERIAKRILLILALIGVIVFMFAAAGCTSEQCKPAIIQLTERDVRDSRGHFKTPVHAVTGEFATTQQIIYRTASAAEMHGPIYTIHTQP